MTSEIILNIANNFDVYFNFTHMRPEWKIGNILSDENSEIVSRIINGKENIVNKTFLSMMETLGYDVRLVYEKRDSAI